MKTAVVLLSGGLDSATALAMANAEGYDCYALSMDYGQRHSAELQAATRVAAALGVKQQQFYRLDLAVFGGSALTDQGIAVPDAKSPITEPAKDIDAVNDNNDIPITYVPARNTIMLSIALAWAEVLEAEAIYAGMNAVDYSGYPDCRPEYIAAFQTMADLATKSGVEGHGVQIRTPLLGLSKAEIIQRGLQLGIDYGLTVSCYRADSTGAACGDCESCMLRHAGFNDAGVADPTRYVAVNS